MSSETPKRKGNLKSEDLNKALPKTHQENAANFSGFLGHPVAQDNYLEQTGAVPQQHTVENPATQLPKTKLPWSVGEEAANLHNFHASVNPATPRVLPKRSPLFDIHPPAVENKNTGSDQESEADYWQDIDAQTEGRSLASLRARAKKGVKTRPSEATAILDDDPTKKSEREFSADEAAWLAKNAVAGLLKTMTPIKPHPNQYEWHDGHTDHHFQADMAGAQLPGLIKHGEPHPHMDTPPKNDQAAGVGVNTYKQFAVPYGNVDPGTSSNLLHYKYHGKLPEIEKLVADHGYKTYYAGGKYGKPDLANKNYNTGHLMVYDPSPGSGGDFSHEEYTKGWRQIHELSHAQTYPELNKIYGEGRRIGKLGNHRTLNEALRAVHWEWLAAHKQRELSKQIGVHINDEDFNKELGTVMHDAVHRAVTGKFTEPSAEGFIPHGHKVPLHTALQMVRDSAHQMGLTGLHDLIPKKGLAKALDWQKPKEVTVAHVGDGVYMTSKVDGKTKLEHHKGGTSKTIARTDSVKEAKAKATEDLEKAGVPGLTSPKAALHSSVEGFMGALKAIPKGDPARGKHITAHMNHGPFLQALQAHPQGKSIHSMLSQHLNSTANAGFKPGATVATVKSDSSGDNLFKTETSFKTEGNTSMADEKTYSPEEARVILMKATREKVESFEKQIEALRSRELKKALIPTHRHTGHAQASSGIEDVPPGKANPKGVDKAMAKEELCKTCGKPHELNKCGDMKAVVEKSDLVDAKGQRSDNHTVAGSKLPDDAKSKKVNEGTASNPGSGGIKLPGASLKKSATPPTAKPPSGQNMGTAVPTSAPKAPAMKADLEKAALGAAQMAQHAQIAGSKAALAPGGAGPKLPGADVQATRAQGYEAAAAGAFQPKGPINSGLELASKPKAPGAEIGLKSPKAAGVTRGAISAGPVMNAARPAAGKPGIFGRLFGKGEMAADKKTKK